MSSNHENDRLLDEILKQTDKKNTTAPAAKPQQPKSQERVPRESGEVKTYEPKHAAQPYQPKYAAPERSVAEPSDMEKTTIRQRPETPRPRTEDSLDVPVAGEERPQVRPRPQMSKAERDALARKKKRRRRNKSAGRIYGVLIMLTLIIVISVMLSVGIIAVGKDMIGIEGTQTLVPFTIPEGATTSEIADDLHEAGIIEYPKAFVLFSRLSNADASYVAGEHEVSSIMAYEALIDELTGVEVENRVTVDVMFPEGISVYDAAKKLEEANVCEAQKFVYYFNQANYGYKFEDYLPTTMSKLKFCKMEGYLFPDTYTFYENMEPEEVCLKIYKNFNVKMTDAYYARMQELELTLDEMVTLASIVQAEAANKKDMKDVASVFWNRLNNPAEFTKLQSDPTSKYVEQVIKPNIDLADQTIYDAYDTYVCTGLPAGAIGNPGLDAIEAVLYPSDTDYFYFYANVETGVTYFARTLEEHYQNEAMIKEQQKQAEEARKNAEAAQ